MSTEPVEMILKGWDTMSNALGIIYANSGTNNLQGLALERPVAAVPFGGRYRILDFALSSMVNSGIRTIGIVTPHNFRPLLDHLGAGKDWFLDRKDGGLFILPGEIHGLTGKNHSFCLKDLKPNLEYLEKEFLENVVICNGEQIVNLNFKSALEYHRAKQADVTLLYKVDFGEDDTGEDENYERILEMDSLNQVSTIYDQASLEGVKSVQPHFVNMLIIRRQLLITMLEKYSSGGCVDILDFLAENLKNLRIYGYLTSSLVWMIRTSNHYFMRSMDLLRLEYREKLWSGADGIHTKIVDNPPTRYSSKAKVCNSLIASGCSIAGEVMNSIIFRGVILEEGSKIRNSIIMSNCHIHANAQTDYAILDKSVVVNEDNVLKGSLTNPLVVLKRTVI